MKFKQGDVFCLKYDQSRRGKVVRLARCGEFGCDLYWGFNYYVVKMDEGRAPIQTNHGGIASEEEMVSFPPSNTFNTCSYCGAFYLYEAYQTEYLYCTNQYKTGCCKPLCKYCFNGNFQQRGGQCMNCNKETHRSELVEREDKCFLCASKNDSSTFCVRAIKDGVGDLIYIYRHTFSKKWKRSIHIDCTKAAEISWKPITETIIDFEEFPKDVPITTPYMFHRCSTCYSIPTIQLPEYNKSGDIRCERKLCDKCYLQSSSCGHFTVDSSLEAFCHNRHQSKKNKNWAKYVISREFRQ